MSQSAAPVQEKPATKSAASQPAAAAEPVAPPEEAFWIRYSPHHELPLSTLGSVAVHVLAVALIFVLMMVALRFNSNKDRPLEVTAVQIGGGGGNPQGAGSGPGLRNAGDPEVVDNPPDKDRTPETPKPDKLNPVEASKLTLPEYNKDPDIVRLMQISKETVASIGTLNQQTRNQLAKGLRSGQGEGGGGRDGGKEKGIDKGKDSMKGPGTSKGDIVSKREKRVLRWVMVFNTLNGDDYAKQLHAMGATLAIPDPREANRYFVIRDLTKRPAQPQPEDLGEIKQIYWVDSKPESVDRLARALGLKQRPEHFVAFFPVQLEEKLLKMELDRARGRTEDDIAESKFNIQRAGNTYVPVLVDQKYLR